MIRLGTATFGLIAWMLVAGVGAADDAKLAPDQMQALRAQLSVAHDLTIDVAPFERKIIEAHGSIDPALEALTTLADDVEQSDATRRGATWLLVRLQVRLGDVDDARTRLEKEIEQRGAADPAGKLLLGELHEAAGKAKLAEQVYEQILKDSPDHEAATTARWNLGLLRLTAPGAGADAMAMVSEALTLNPDLGTGAGVTLAILGRPKDAGTLVATIDPVNAKAYWRGAIRAAEWALAAKDAKVAQEHAWRAVKAAPLRRDRRYSLGVLLDAHRQDESLDACLARFAAESEPSAELFDVWVDLLRELGRVDEALALFRKSSGTTFTDTMQRSLLELCREAGREEALVAAFESLIEKEPNRVEWREGLSRHWLTKAQREKAEALWVPMLAQDNPHTWLQAATSLAGLGLEDRSIEFAQQAAAHDQTRAPALLFLFDLYFTRGRVELADEALTQLEAKLAPPAKERMQLADAYERLGKKPVAAKILTGLREARGLAKSEVDLDIRLAVLLSETDQEKEALALWRRLWEKVTSIPRRRFVEDRMLTIAARLGTLADLAVELEERLSSGEGSERESGLLVRLYTKVNDPVSAAEILGEHVRRSGGSALSALKDQARIYLTCTDFLSYERTVRKLIRLDPEGETDYLRQLAMSALERGRPQEARETLTRMKNVAQGADSDEFEAGVLALGGLEPEAIEAYRRGIVRHPDRIEAYLLLANVMRKTGKQKRAIGMFQNLVQRAVKDDLYTVAVDGLLNMEAPQPVLKWARRRTLARLARRPDKTYLYQLVSDLSEELKDRAMQERALANALPSAGEQRTSLLRELLELSRSGSGGFSPFGRSTGGNNAVAQLRYGRRLLGLGDLVPPQVYLDLGTAFLKAGDVGSAAKTFRRATDLPDYHAFQLQVAGAFQSAGYVEEALRVYEEALIGASTNVSLVVKVARTHETLGHLADAADLFGRATELMLARRPFSTQKEENEQDESYGYFYWRSGNVDAYDQHYSTARTGLLATLSDEAADRALRDEQERIEKDLEAANKRKPKKKEDFKLSRYPRLSDRVDHFRRVAYAFDAMDRADGLDTSLLQAFPDDDAVLADMVKWRKRHGLTSSARRLMDASGRTGKALDRARVFVGAQTKGGGRPHTSTLVRQMLPAIAAGDDEQLRGLLRDVQIDELGDSTATAFPVLVALDAHLDDADLVLLHGRAWMAYKPKANSGRPMFFGSSSQMALAQCWPHLNAKERRSLIGTVVRDVMENIEKSLSSLPQLVTYQKKLGEQLLTDAQIEKILDKVKSKGLRFPAGALELVPEARRNEVLDSMWRKSAPTSRVWFLIQLATAKKGPIDDKLREFILERFDAAVEGMKARRTSIGWYVQSLVDQNEAEAALALELAERMAKVMPEESMFDVTRAAALHKLERTDEALALAQKSLGSLYNVDRTDWRKANAARSLINVFLPKHAEQARKALEALEKEHGLTPLALDLHMIIAAAENKREQVLDLLLRAVKSAPENEQFLQSLANEYRMRGDVENELAIAKRMLETQPENKAHRNRLAGIWNRLRNPLEAKRVKEDDSMPKVKAEDKREVFQKPTIQRLKDAVEAGRTDEARTIHHQLWRGLGHVGSPSRGVSYMIVNGVLQEYMPGFGSWFTWPTKKKVSKRRGGGIPDYAAMKTYAERQKETTPTYDVLAQHDYATAEMRVQLRAHEPSMWGMGPGPLYEGLAKALVRERGTKGAIDHLLDRHRRGQASTHDFALLLLILEKADDEGRDDVAEILAEVSETILVFDTTTTRRLARVYAHNGLQAEAERLYAWLAAQSPNAARGLINEVLEVMTGEIRDRTLTSLLAGLKPKDTPVSDPWRSVSFGALDAYHATVLNTWGKVLEPQEVLDRYREMCEASLDTKEELQRASAGAATYLYARAGEHAQALRCLEVALCRFPDWKAPDRPDDPSWRWRKTYIEQRARNGGNMGSMQVKELFPPDPQGWTDAGAWFSLCAGQLQTWLDEERLVPRSAESVLAVLVVRLYEHGHEDQAFALLEWLLERPNVHPTTAHWFVDAARMTGKAELAHTLEMRLLAAKQLHPDRISRFLDRVAEEQGVAVAHKQAVAISEWCQDTELLRQLIRWSRESGADDEATTWLARAKEAWPDESFE